MNAVVVLAFSPNKTQLDRAVQRKDFYAKTLKGLSNLALESLTRIEDTSHIETPSCVR